MSAPNRNQPCPCGSGKRYKHCCGLAGAAAVVPKTPPQASLNEFLFRALACQRAGQLVEASSLYRSALQLSPDHFDALHMLGVTLYQLGKAEDGARLILKAIRDATQEPAAALSNLGLCLAQVARGRGISGDGDEARDEDLCHPRFLRRNRLPAASAELPGVSVLLLVGRQTRHAEAALASVLAQSHVQLEVIVIDRGAGAERLAALHRQFASGAREHRFVTADGSSAALHTAIEAARHPWIAVVDGQDLLAPQRFDWMLRAMAAEMADWGFSGVALIDENSHLLQPGRNVRADLLFRGLEVRYRLPAFGAGFSVFNYAVALGNLLFRKSLWQAQGGFADYRHVADWDFCLRALLRSEPCYVDEPLYLHRVDSNSPSGDAQQAAASETEAMLNAWMSRLSGEAALANPALAGARKLHMKQDLTLMSEGRGHLVGKSRLLNYAAQLALD